MSAIELDGGFDEAGPTTAPEGVVVGVMSTSWTIQHLSVDERGILVTPAPDLVGRPLVDRIHPDDVVSFMSTTAQALSTSRPASVELRVGVEGRRWTRVRLVLSPLVDEERTIGFTMSEAHGDADPGRRSAWLEHRLWRIAQEIEAAGIVTGTAELPGPRAIPGLDDLSSRELEVLRLLLGGARVSTIARELFLSPSTIRNHLSSIFTKVGVHSQAELVQLLRSHRDPD